MVHAMHTQSHVYNRIVTRNYSIHIKPLFAVPVQLLLKEGFTESSRAKVMDESPMWALDQLHKPEPVSVFSYPKRKDEQLGPRVLC